jgi:hypothetical protein
MTYTARHHLKKNKTMTGDEAEESECSPDMPEALGSIKKKKITRNTRKHILIKDLYSA